MDELQSTINQHYVWRFYLRPWCYTDKNIWCLRKGKIFHAPLTRIACEKKMYELDELTPDDELFIQKSIDDIRNPTYKKMDQEWFYVYKTVLTWYNTVSKLPDLAKLANFIKINAGEKLFCQIENIGEPYIIRLQNKDCDFYKNEDDRISFNIFICEQFLRTKKMEEAVQNSLKGSRLKTNGFWNIYRHIIATNLACSITYHETPYSLVLLENDSSVPFITGDQPVINTYYKEFDAEKDIMGKHFEFYYPISPSVAILIIQDKQSIIKISEEKANELNMMIFENSREQIYTHSEEELNRFKDI